MRQSDQRGSAAVGSLVLERGRIGRPATVRAMKHAWRLNGNEPRPAVANPAFIQPGPGGQRSSNA